MKVLVIGTGKVGGAAVQALSDRGHDVVRASRTSAHPVDATDPESIARLFASVGTVDAVVAALGSAPYKPLAELGHDDFLSGLLSKTLAQIDIVQIGTPYLADGGSFTLTTGVLAREPIRTGAASSAANGALEAFTMAAAAELPRGIRINTVSPTVLVEATSHHPSFPGFTQIPAAAVGQAFVKAVEGVQTGQVYRARRAMTGAGTNVVVIGGGAVGLITAYHLHRAGADVTLIDARRTGRGAAEVNAGWICPAESAPVPGPGMISKSLKWMLHRDSPLYIRPEPTLGFVKFMLGMWKSSNGPMQRTGFEAHLRLAQGTIEAYEDYRADGIDFELRHDGLLMAFTDRENLDHHRQLLDLAERFDRDPQVLIGDDVRNHEPLLSDRVYGGIFFPKEQHVDPHALMRSLHGRLVQGGVRILENAPLAGVRTERQRIIEITAGTERLAADAYLLAAGAWTGRLSRLLGVPLPVRPGKGYSIDVDPFPLRSSTNLSDAKVAVTPLTRNLRLAGTMEFGGLDEELNQIRIGAILRGPAVYFRDWTPPAPDTITPRAGIRPMTPDGMPIIGRLGELSNAYVSTGHGMQGITLGPGSALALTALVLRGEVPDVLLPFTPARFTRAVVRKSPQLAAAR